VNHPVILFDGVCNLCNGAVNFVIRHDTKNIFRFATLQSQAGQQFLHQFDFTSPDMRSFVLIDNGKAYQKSTAALRVLKYLPWHLKAFRVFLIVPSFIRNGVYDIIARHRYKWFGKKEVCMVPTAELKAKFLH